MRAFLFLEIPRRLFGFFWFCFFLFCSLAELANCEHEHLVARFYLLQGCALVLC